MGTAAKIIGVEDSAISKMNGVTLTGVSKVAGQDILSFTNTYSMNFDGSDDVVELASPMTTSGTDWSISFWFKTSHTSGGKVITYNASKYFMINWNRLDFISSDNSFDVQSTSGMADDNWHHGVFAYNYTSGNWTCYIDGSSDTNQTATTGVDIPPWEALGAQVGGANSFLGNLDDIAYWNIELDADAVAVIYNSGTPTDLSVNSGNYDNSGNLQGYWRMGDNGSFKSTQWLIPDNANKDKVSNYSMEFDGSNDYVDIGVIPYFEDSINKFSYSFWFKNVLTSGMILCITSKIYGIMSHSSIAFYIVGTGGTAVYSMAASAWGTTWHNVTFVYDGSGAGDSDKIKVYRDGSLDSAAGRSGTYPASTLASSVASTISAFYSRTGYFYKGSVDEVAIWDEILDADAAAAIYNSGVPINLAANSGDYDNSGDLIGWWRMGEEATFSTNWTIPDSSTNSNNGTSANMDIADRVGNAPNSANNAISINMVIGDREEETP